MTSRAIVLVCAVAVVAMALAVPRLGFTASPDGLATGVGQPEPTKWEYLALTRMSLQGALRVEPVRLQPASVTSSDLARLRVGLLNKLGDDGWELCASVANEHLATDLYFKRPKVDDPVAGVVVYVTRTGTEYHRSGCQRLEGFGRTALSARDAAQMYEPCALCEPPVVSDE